MGTHVMSTDEKTGMQALERLHATKPGRPGLVERVEFEYVRHGTLSLIANFDVATGKVVSPSIGPTRTEADFVAHIDQTIEADPEAGWIFVTDQLDTHRAATLVELVARRCGIQDDLGTQSEGRHPQIEADSPGVPGGPDPQDSLRLHASPLLVAEPS
jgi:hypothetical protein